MKLTPMPSGGSAGGAPSSRRSRGRLLASVVALGVVASGAAVTAGSPAAADSSADSSAAPSGATHTDSRLVTLVTGDQVVVTDRNGREGFVIRPSSGSDSGSSAFASFQDASGDHYVIPAAAQPYVGTELDLSLFDVTALAKQASGSSGSQAAPDQSSTSAAPSVPVTVSFARGTQPSAPTGTTLTSTSGSSARGYVTAASGRKLARLLRKRIGADVKAKRKPGSTPLFAGVTAISLTGAAGHTAPAVSAAGAAEDTATAGSAAATSQYKLHILQINAEDENGAAAEGMVLLTNTDDMTAMTAILPVDGGIERVALPAGHYSAAMPMADFDTAGNVTSQHLVSLSDLTVADSATGTTTVDLDGRTATEQVTASTPRQATQDFVGATWGRSDATGVPIGYAPTASAISDDTTPVYVNPQPAAAVGTIGYFVQWSGHAPDAADNYRYDLTGAVTDDVPADQTLAFAAHQLAAVQEHYSGDPASPTDAAFVANAPDFTGLPFSGSSDAAQLMPADVTDYLSTNQDGIWTQQVFQGSGLGFYSNRAFAPGHTYTADWGHGPLAPGFGQYTVQGSDYVACDACVAGGTLYLNTELNDSDSDHWGTPTIYDAYPSTTTSSLYQDGTLVDSEPYASSYVTDQPDSGADYRFVVDEDQTANPTISQSTVSHTEVTFRTPASTDTSFPVLPAGIDCAKPADDTPCYILPVLTAHYQLDTDGYNTSHRQAQTMGLNIGHLSYNGIGSTNAITSATVQVSFDDGQTWQKASVHGAAGHYLAGWTNPASARGTSPSLRVTATDAAGGTFTQTITHAYTLAAATS